MVESRKTEIVYKTSDPSRMIDKYLTKSVYRTWTETYYDNDIGENISIERNELLFDKGTLITNDLIPKIRFFMEEGSVQELEVSNQKRMAYAEPNQRMYPYQSVVQIKDKKHRFLLYAMSVTNALDILNDYIELNYNGMYDIQQIKEFERCVVIEDSLDEARIDYGKAFCEGKITAEEFLNEVAKSVDNEDEHIKADMKWYKILARILHKDVDGNETENSWLFVVKSLSAERANILINIKVKMMQEDKKKEAEARGEKFIGKDVMSVIEESSVIPVGCFIPKDFSEVYGE